MKLALCTTTINIPGVLALYRKYGGPDVGIFVAGDEKTPPGAARFCDSIDAEYLSLDDQFRRYPLLSELVGKSCIQRRNFAFLEALRWGAEAIITIDDDVIPLNAHYFSSYDTCFGNFNGIEVAAPGTWFDPGQMLVPPIRHRGLPLGLNIPPPQISPVVGADVGVVVGLWAGDADVDATARISNPPAVHSFSALAQVGVVVNPNTLTVFNAQNVGFIRELAPAMFMMPSIGRADDILASLITQRVMGNRCVFFGEPFTVCWQKRSAASMLRDLEEELFTLRHVQEFANYLQSPIVLERTTGRPVFDQVRAIYEDMQGNIDFPERTKQAAMQWVRELEKVL